MINAIYQIGKKVAGENLDRDNFLKNICLKLDSKNKSETKQHIVILNFNTETKKIEVGFEDINADGKDTGKEYLWVGNNPGRKDQIYFITDNPIYLFTKTLPNIKKRVVGSLKIDIENILSIFFITKNNSYIINPSKFDLFKVKGNDIIKKLTSLKEKISIINIKNEANEIIKELRGICSKMNIKLDLNTKGRLEDVKKEIQSKYQELISLNINEKLEEYYLNDIIKRSKPQGDKRESAITNDILNIKQLSKSNVSMYAFKLNNDFLGNTEEYKSMIFTEKISNLFDRDFNAYKNNLTVKGKCSICNRINFTPTSSNTTNLGFNYYMTDKLGFSSNLDGKFKNNYNICKDCYQYLMVAERFIDEELKSRIGGLDVYIIPNMIFPIKDFQIEEFSKYISLKTGQISTITDLKEIEKELENYISYEDKKNSYIINYLFFHHPPGKSEFKILKLIKDISPTRIDFIRKTEEDIQNLINDNYNEIDTFRIDLNRIWGCIPIKQKSNTYTGTSKYLDILDSVFSETPVNYSYLINQAIDTIKIIKYETPKYNIWEKQDFTYKIIQLNFLILFFKKLNLIGGTSMEENNETNQIKELIPREISEYWTNLEIYNDNSKKGLFLLGYLIGEIGNEQRNVKDMKKKPILNKVNFQGMGTEKLIRLTSDVLEKLRQNNILEYNDNTFSASHMLIEENIMTWKLSNQENVFYVLSGYAFSNYLVRKRSKEKYFKELKEKMEFIEKAKNENQNIEEFEKFLENAKEQAGTHNYYEARNILKSIKMEEN